MYQARQRRIDGLNVDPAFFVASRGRSQGFIPSTVSLGHYDAPEF